MQLLAAVEGDGTTSLGEALLNVIPRVRRGMTAVVITASMDRGWIKPLTALRARGVACVVIACEPAAFERQARAELARRTGADEAPPDTEAEERSGQAWRAIRHALAEFDIGLYRLAPTVPLGELLAS
jgi:Mg-chelatase subunit ChlD